MRKILTRSFFINIALFVGFLSVSCTSDKLIPHGGNDYTGERTLSLNFAPAPHSRLASRPIPNSERLQLNNGHLFLVTQAGIIAQHFTIGDFPALYPDGGVDVVNRNINRRNLGYYRHNNNATPIFIPDVPGNVHRVIIVGNTHISGWGANIDTFIGQSINNIESQFDAMNVNLWGESILTRHPAGHNSPGTNNPIFVAHVHLTPSVARFEITEIQGRGDIESFTIAASIALQRLFLMKTICVATPT